MWRQIVLMAFLVLAACSQTETVKIGVVAPLSGPLGFYGSDMVKGAEFALAEINADGGINGKHVELIFEDTECKPEPTQKALKKFKDLDGVVGYIGPFCGSPEEVAWSFSEEQKFLGITANNNYGKKSEWFFSVMPLVEYEDKMLAEHAFTQGLRKIGIMHQDNYFGEMHKDYFTQYFEELGGEITHIEAFGFADKDFRTTLTKIGQESDGLFVIYSSPGTVLNQIKELGLDMQVFGQWGMQNSMTLDIAGENANGVVYPFPAVEASEAFIAKFGEARTFTVPATYDALHILADALDECEMDNECSNKYIQALENYPGASGDITFDDETWDVGKEYVLKTIQNESFVLL